MLSVYTAVPGEAESLYGVVPPSQQFDTTYSIPSVIAAPGSSANEYTAPAPKAGDNYDAVETFAPPDSST